MTFSRIIVSFLAVSFACALPGTGAAQQMSEEMVKAASTDVAPVIEESPEKPAAAKAAAESQVKIIEPSAPQGKSKEPAAADKPEVNKTETAPAASLPGFKAAAQADVMTAEWDYLRSYGDSKDDDVLAAVLPQLSGWIKTYPDSANADDALLLKANLQLKLDDYRSAIMTLVRFTQEFPDSQFIANARLLLNNTIDKKLSKKMKAPLTAIAKAPEAQDKAERLALVIRKMADQYGEDFYAPVLAEFGDFFLRYPSYAGRDAMQMSLGNLYVRKGESILARLAYEKLIQVHPDSQLLVKAKRALGDVLANDIKDYFAAIKVYQDITANFPGTEEAWAAYAQLPRLTERQKQYEHAVKVYEEIIKLYPDKPEARNSFKAEARVLREEMKKPAEAVAVLNRLADKYKDEKVIEELYLAAEIARKDMKDLDTEVKMYDRIAAEYPDNKEAPKALMAAGKAYEKAKNIDKAKEYYTKVEDKYPDDSLAKKAQGYLFDLSKP